MNNISCKGFHRSQAEEAVQRADVNGKADSHPVLHRAFIWNRAVAGIGQCPTDIMPSGTYTVFNGEPFQNQCSLIYLLNMAIQLEKCTSLYFCYFILGAFNYYILVQCTLFYCKTLLRRDTGEARDMFVGMGKFKV